jgi:hypothetical protein
MTITNEKDNRTRKGGFYWMAIFTHNFAHHLKQNYFTQIMEIGLVGALKCVVDSIRHPLF